MPLDTNEDSNVFGMDEGCPEHGSARMIECSACGGEFCALCFPRSAVCADCAEGGGLEEDARGEDFDDVTKVDKVLDEDKAASEDEEESP